MIYEFSQIGAGGSIEKRGCNPIGLQWQLKLGSFVRFIRLVKNRAEVPFVSLNIKP